MTEATPARPSRRSRYRRWHWAVIALAVPALFTALAGYLFDRYLRIETYRPLLESRIEEATGLPAHIGRLSLALRPLPVIRADGVRIGGGDFTLAADRALIWPEARALLERRIHVTRIDLEGLAAVAPADPTVLRDRLRALGDLMRGRGGDRTIRFEVDRIQAPQARLSLDTPETPVFTGDIGLGHVLSRTPSARVEGKVLALPDAPGVEGTVVLQRGADGQGIERVQGSFAIDGLRLAEVLPSDNTPRVSIEVEGVFGGEDPQSVTVRLGGQVEPLQDARALGESLEGPFRAEALWNGEVLDVRDVEWAAAGVRVGEGRVTRDSEGVVRVEVPEAILGRVTLAPLLARIESASWRFSAERGATAEVADLAVTVAPGASVRVDRGSVRFAGLGLVKDGENKVVDDLEGTMHLSPETVRIEEVRGDGLRVEGVVTPDYDTKTVAVDLKGAVRASRERLALILPVEALRQADGAVTVERVAGTFGGAQGLPADFVVEGRVTDGRLVLATERVQDVFAPVTGRFTARHDAVDFEAQGVASEMGPVTLAGRYDLGDRAFTGTAVFDVEQAVAPHLAQGRAREVVPSLLAAYGPSTFDLEVQFPTEDRRRGGLSLARQGDPPLRGTVALVRGDNGIASGDIQATATLPLARAVSALPDGVVAEGPAELSFVRDATRKTFTGTVGLTQADIRWSRYARKKPGVGAQVVVGGTAGDSWQGRTLDATVAGETVRGVWEGSRLVFANLDLDAAALAPLLGDGIAVRGRVTGSVVTGPTRVDLALRDLGVAWPSGAALDSITGGVGYSGDTLALENLRVRAANSDAVLTLVREQDRWRGTVAAERLDVTAVHELRKAIRQPAAAGTSAAPVPQSSAGPPFRGRIDFQAAALLYRRATVPEVRAVVRDEGNGIALDGLSAKPAGGTLTGDATVTRPEPQGPWVARGTLHLDGVDAQAVDELAFAEPRGLGGALTGEIGFDVPVVEGSPVNAAGGHARLTGAHGTFGRFGLATQVLNVLRTAEVFRLRLPSLRDQGLTYDTASLTMTMERGVMTVEEFALERPSFAMRGEGVVNFPADDMFIEFDIYPFQTVTGVVERVPIVGRAVSELRKLAPLGLVARGSPYDPTVTPESLTPGQARVRESVRTTPPPPEPAQPQPETEPEPETVEEPAADSEEEDAARPGNGGRGIGRGLRDAAKGLLDSVRGR